MKRIDKSLIADNKGFTLIELIITVAVIGILAKTGVSSYKRMVQKSKTGEAKVILASIALGESAFQSEYGTYGDNLAQMGVQVEGSKFVYAAGVNVAAGCKQKADNGFFPAGVVGTLSRYQYGVNDSSGARFGNMLGNLGQTSCKATPAVTASTYTASATGYLPKDSLNCNSGAGGANCDQWTIDNNRDLKNIANGVN